jgi:EAL domain-containing protein (putative c-di-GMP-specific phosphodiesterase class I)
LYELKIDQTFVRSIPHEPGGTAIVQSIISLAKNLNLKVVAEGVESEEQLKFLQDAGCDLLQGYFLSRPLPIGSWIESTTERLA